MRQVEGMMRRQSSAGLEQLQYKLHKLRLQLSVNPPCSNVLRNKPNFASSPYGRRHS